MSAGQVWQRPDGLVWVEIQTGAMEPSGWCVLVPLLAPADAPEAPPLVVAVDGWHARVHLLTTAPADELGTENGRLELEDLEMLRDAARALIDEE